MDRDSKLSERKALAVEMTSLGSNLEQVADAVDCSERTIRNWMKNDVEFKRQMRGARTKRIHRLRKSAFELAVDEDLEPKQRAAVLIFMLKAFGGYSERPAEDQAGHGQRSEIVGVRYVPTRGGDDA